MPIIASDVDLAPFEGGVVAQRHSMGIVRLYTTRQVMEQRDTILTDHTVREVMVFHDCLRAARKVFYLRLLLARIYLTRLSGETPERKAV